MLKEATNSIMYSENVKGVLVEKSLTKKSEKIKILF
jgi:hypothetical protein